MTTIPKKKWTCDRCGATAESEPASKPSGWSSVCWTEIEPESAPMEASWWTRWHLCQTCRDLFAIWRAEG